MATTGIWKIEKRLDHVLDYTTNPDKTINESYGKNQYQEFHNFIEYSDCDYKNEKECYVSGINCLPETAYEDMMFTKKQYDKTKGIIGYHAFQSFKEKEVTPDQAHLIGVKLAEEMWGDRFEVVVSTHSNTNHIHNHFVINSVSFKDGKKYHDCRESYALLRHTSDSICQEFGLSVLEKNKCKKEKVNYDNYYKGYINKSNYHSITKQDIDRAITMAYSFKDFENLMIRMGYEITNRYGKLSVKREPYKKNIRIERSFGEDYSISKIEERIENTSAPRIPFIEEYNPNNKIKVSKILKKEKSKGLYGLYKYYCYILKIYPVHYPNKILSPQIRLDIKKMNEISEQTKLLVNNKIETYEQFLFYKNTLETDIEILCSKRHNLWIKYKRVKNNADKEQIRDEIENITQMLKIKRKEVVLCDEIEKRSNIVEKNLKELETEKGREKKK